MPIEIAEDDSARLCIRQTGEGGEEQAIILGLGQAEQLANWIIQYAQTATDAMMDE